MLGRSTLLVGSLLAGLASSATAQPIDGLYLAAGAGVNLRAPSNQSNGHSSLTTEPGPVGIAGLGWGFGNGLRTELEGSYRSNAVSGLKTRRLDGLLEDTSDPRGRVGTAATMANLLYDFDLGRFGLPVRPYLGGGIGYGWRQYDGVAGDEPLRLTLPGNNTVVGPGQTARTGTYGHWAYQAIAGFAVPLRFLPGWEVTAEYRYFVMNQTKFKGTAMLLTTNTINGSVPGTQGYGYDDSHNHSVLIGLRYVFGAPRPVAPALSPTSVAAPAPMLARSYLVFFDWDRADLTERARQIIAEAAQAVTRVQVTRIEVAGYTDTSGTSPYNQALSVRRARNVAAELVRLGVPRQAIMVQGFGESRPLVPTGPGVREPQNRRVEIVLR